MTISRRGLVAMIATQVVALSTAPLMPFIVGGLIDDYGLDAGTAGLAVTIQLMVAALTSLGVAARLGRWGGPQLVCGAALLSAVGQGLVAWQGESVALLMFSRLIAGLGQGALMAAAAGAAARTGRAERIYAFYSLTVGLYAIAMLNGAPPLLERFGIRAAFALLAAVDLLGILLLIYFPSFRTGDVAEAPPLAAPRRFVYVPLAIAAIAIGIGGLQAFLERLGQAVGLGLQEIGGALAVAAALGVAAPLLVLAVGLRFGRAPPVAAAVLTMGAVSLGMVMTDSGWIYMVSAVLLAPANQFLVPYLFGVLGLLDPSGRLAGAGPAFLTGGVALGPLVGGLLTDNFGLASVGYFGALGCVVGLAVLVPVIRRAEAAAG